MQGTHWLAVYGAVLSTIVAAYQLRQWRVDRPRLRLLVQENLRDGTRFVHIEALNEGRRPLVITELGVVLDAGDRCPLRTERSTLREQQSVDADIDLKDFAADLILRRGTDDFRLSEVYATSATGRFFHQKLPASCRDPAEPFRSPRVGDPPLHGT